MVNTKKLSKVIYIVLVMMILMTAIMPVVNAAMTPENVKIDDSNTDKVANVGGRIIGFVRTIGLVVSVLVLVFLGIKYMLGSPDEKAEYKKTMMPYIIGAILVFAASAIATAIYQFSSSVTA